MSPHVGKCGGKWIELNPIRTMDDTTILSRLLQRMMVVNLCSNLFEKLKLAEISGLASGTASGGGGAGRGCQRRLDQAPIRVSLHLTPMKLGLFRRCDRERSLRGSSSLTHSTINYLEL